MEYFVVWHCLCAGWRDATLGTLGVLILSLAASQQ